MFVKTIFACSIAMALGSCAFSEALFFSGDNVTSYKKESATIAIEVTNSETCGGRTAAAFPPAIAAAT